MQFFEKDTRTAIEAQAHAQFIAWGPMVFQAARALRNLGILDHVGRSRTEGITLESLVEKTGVSTYGVRVLLEAGLGIGLVSVRDGKFTLTKTGYFILRDEMTQVQMDFVQDVCYQGMFSLEDSIRTGRPEGLKALGPWKTVYEGLASLPEPIRKSWFAFDHFFSDRAFPAALPLVYDGRVKRLLDIGGNTGKWAIASTRFAPDIHVTIADLPGQLADAEKAVRDAGLEDRVGFVNIDLLDPNSEIPGDFDAIWMSQFLDCFSEAEIGSILRRCHEALPDDGVVFILEDYWDRQKYETAAFCLQQTSLYFTAIANGNSQMYDSRVFDAVVRDAGFEIAEIHDEVGLGHTLYRCVKSGLAGRDNGGRS